MKNIELENKNEFIIKSNKMIASVNSYLSLIKKLTDVNLDNIADIYFEKKLELEKYYNSQGLKYFELEDSITNKIIENYLFNFSLYGFYRLEKIIKIVAKYYGLPFFNFFGNIIINKILKEYQCVCKIIKNFTVKENFLQSLCYYIDINNNLNIEELEDLKKQLLFLKINNIEFIDLKDAYNAKKM